jgi:molybdopterin biosynthesis enzyme
LISTGNELVNASTVKLDDGKIRDSNKLMLTSLLKSAGLVSEIIDYGIVKDQGTELDPVM